MAALSVLLGPAVANEPDEDHRLACPLVSPELAAKAAEAVKGHGTCQVQCNGCGCKGGPGYRSSSGRCVGWANLIRECGPPPHAACVRECAIVEPTCAAGRVWLKALAAGAGLALTFTSPAAEEPAGAAGSPEQGPPAR